MQLILDSPLRHVEPAAKHRDMRARFATIPLLFSLPAAVLAGPAESIAAALARSIIDSNLPMAEVQAYTEGRVPLMPQVKSTAEWEKLARQMRESTLDKVVFR